MARHKQPICLQMQCHLKMASCIVAICQKLVCITQRKNTTQVLASVKASIRTYFHSMLPGPVRSSLIHEVVSRITCQYILLGMDVNMGKYFLFLLYLLFSQEVKHLTVNLCCYFGCSDQQRILRFLCIHGSGLETLELARSSILRLDNELFASLLLTTEHLKQLILKNICSDNMLPIIGTTCQHLETLDMSNSKQVTDAGIKELCVQVEIMDKTSTTDDSNKPNPQNFTCCRKLFSCIFSTCRTKYHSFNEEMTFLELHETKNPCCDTLREMCVEGTRVTSNGVFVALQNITTLRSLGEYILTGQDLQSVSGNCEAADIKFNKLASIHVCKTAAIQLSIISETCPNLQALTMIGPHLMMADICCFKKLKCLHLCNLESEAGTVRDIYTFLNDEGKYLNDLGVKFNSFEQKPILDLYMIGKSCPNLRYLDCGYSILTYNNPLSYHGSCNCFQNLMHVQLGKTVKNEAIQEILHNGFRLKSVHFHTCPDLKDSDLLQYTKNATSRNLECFYIYNAPQLTAEAFITIMHTYDNIVKVGNISKWVVNCVGVNKIEESITQNNLDVELLAGSHWFCSTCITSPAF